MVSPEQCLFSPNKKELMSFLCFLGCCHNGEYSSHAEADYGVPQGSMPGPFLFLLSRLHLGTIVRWHNIHFTSFIYL